MNPSNSLENGNLETELEMVSLENNEGQLNGNGTTETQPLINEIEDETRRRPGDDTANAEHQTAIIVARNRSQPCFLYLLTSFSAIGGFLFGYDTGVVSGAMLLLVRKFYLNTFWEELIVSITIGGAILFALLGSFFNDFFGRRPTILLASFIFTAGAVVMGVAPDENFILGGRLIVGCGIGLNPHL